MLLTLKSAKIVKTDTKYKVLSAVLYLSPSTESGWNLCPQASPGCKRTCLGHSSGRMVMPTHKRARLRRTRFFMRQRARFLRRLYHEIGLLEGRARRKGLRAAVRLNGASDLPWERIVPELFVRFPRVQFYDYTKNYSRMIAYLQGAFPRNYYLTFSRSEVNSHLVSSVLAVGGTVAVVFTRKPKSWQGARVVDGDTHDARFYDRPGVVVGLSAKGKARKDSSGFVVQ